MRLVLLSALLSSGLVCAEPGTVVRKTDLRDKPFLDAPVVTQIEANTLIDIQERQGAWMQVKATAGTGWLKMLNVRTGNVNASGGGSGIGTLANVVKTGSSGKTVTTGVKGLSAEEITNAVPNPAEVDKMDSYASSEAEASRSATQAKLSAQQVQPVASSSFFSTPSSSPSNSPNERRR